MRLEHALFPQMGEKLPAGDVLQEHVELSGVLSESLEADLNGMGCTMKGCEMELRMRYSLAM